MSHGWLRSAMWSMRKRRDSSVTYAAAGVRWQWRCGGSWAPAHQSSESGLNAAPLLSVSLARTPDRGLVTINIASRRFLAPLSFTFSTAIAAVWPDNFARCLRKCCNSSTCKLGYSNSLQMSIREWLGILIILSLFYAIFILSRMLLFTVESSWNTLLYKTFKHFILQQC